MKNKHLTRYVTPRKFILIVYDISATLVAALLSLFVFYFERDIPEVVMQAFKNSWFIYLIVGGIIFYLIGFFDQMWAFASFPQYVLDNQTIKRSGIYSPRMYTRGYSDRK